MLANRTAGNTPRKNARRPDKKRRDEFEAQVRMWTKDPFNPHLIARLRNGTYQRAVVFKYLDNLVAWADDLFRRDTM